MTNKESWDVYTDGLSSPQNFIDWSYRYLISAALQRRVWIPSGEQRLFPNMYVPLVGKPGIGKGNVIRAVSNILSYHKLKDANINPTMSPDEKAALQDIVDKDVAQSKEAINGKGIGEDDPLLIPIASDAVTYEALIQSMARSLRRINYSEYSEKHQREIMKIASHSSLCFCLEEMASLFRKNTESMVNFLIQAYDCGDKYEYRTKTAGVDRVLRLCLNFLAGTTPDFMNEIFDDRLLSQGFSSRSFFIYADKNRKHQFFIPPLTKEQEEARDRLRAHVKSLTKLYGPVTLEDGVAEWLETWWCDYQENPTKRASKSSKMEAYYARKNIHVMKVAMSHHFSETTSMRMGRAPFEYAMEVLHNEEKTMHLALSFGGSNPLSKLSQKVLDLLRSSKRQYADLLVECYSSGTQAEIDEVLEYLAKTGQIESVEEKDEHTDQPVRWWKVKRA